MDELWTCPSCERQFANTNQWHSCIEMAVEEHLAPKTELAVGIYRAVEAALLVCGEFRVHPQKTQIAFIARMTFGGVKLARRWADLSFILPAPVDDPRIRSIELYGPTSFGHRLRLEAAAEVDRDVRRWLCEAHRRGLQDTLDPAAEVDAAVGHVLEHMMVPLRTRVVAHPDGLALGLPQYAAQAFGAHPFVLARIRGAHYPGEIQKQADRPVLWLAEALVQLGLGLGDEADAFLTADL